MRQSHFSLDWKTRDGWKVFALCVTLAALSALPNPALALNASAAAVLGAQTKTGNTDIINVRAAVRRGGVAVGPRGNVAAYRSRTVVRGPVARRGYAGGAVRWARPGWYRWPVGGAIAAGAAVGFVTAAAASAYAGAPPAPGMCWYYTDASRTQGFWDYCPR